MTRMGHPFDSLTATGKLMVTRIMAEKIIKNNKFATFKYFVEKTYEAGIVLNGMDVKAIKSNAFEVRDAFVRESNGELFLWNINFSAGDLGTQKRKLLLKSAEIKKISEILRNKKNHGFVLAVRYNEKNKIKFDLGFGHVKKIQEKNAAERRSTEKRELEREISENY